MAWGSKTSKWAKKRSKKSTSANGSRQCTNRLRNLRDKKVCNDKRTFVLDILQHQTTIPVHGIILTDCCFNRTHTRLLRSAVRAFRASSCRHPETQVEIKSRYHLRRASTCIPVKDLHRDQTPSELYIS